jgi:hypothetical protein
LALIKFLPFAAMIFGKNGRSSIDPDLLRFDSQGMTGRAAKFPRMNSGVSPIRRNGSKCIHAKTPAKVGYFTILHTSVWSIVGFGDVFASNWSDNR